MQGNVKPNRFPDITIKDDVYRRLKAYADLCDNEISALGSVRIEENRILIEDVFLFDQVVTGSSTDISTTAIANFITDYIKKGKDPSVLKFWWHSHARMGVFWSGTDTGTIDRFSSDWMISMVSNKNGDIKVRVDVFEPFRMYMDDLPLLVEYDKSMNDAIRKEINQKVKTQYFPDFKDVLQPIRHGVNLSQDTGRLPFSFEKPAPVISSLDKISANQPVKEVLDKYEFDASKNAPINLSEQSNFRKINESENLNDDMFEKTPVILTTPDPKSLPPLNRYKRKSIWDIIFNR
jgi:hypothetical protein